MATIFFFNYCINTHSKRSACLQDKVLDILFHSSSIAVLNKPIFGWEVAFVLFSKTLHIAESRGSGLNGSHKETFIYFGSIV